MRASRVYRPPVPGEPIRLREDGHWSAEGLRLCLPMREMRGGIVADVGPHGYHGTLVGGPAWAAGERGGAIRLNGTSQVVQRLGEQLLPVTNDFTVAVWVETSDLTSGNNQTLWSAGVRDYYDQILYVCASAGAAVNQIRYFERGALALQSAEVAVGSDVRNTGWRHITTTRQGDGITVYLDGVADAAGVKTYSAVSTGMRWGAAPDTGTGSRFYMPGAIGTASVYSRALSADEIRALYAAPDLPIWRPRRGISLALLGESAATRYPAAHRTHVWRNGPITYVGGT